MNEFLEQYGYERMYHTDKLTYQFSREINGDQTKDTYLIFDPTAERVRIQTVYSDQSEVFSSFTLGELDAIRSQCFALGWTL